MLRLGGAPALDPCDEKNSMREANDVKTGKRSVTRVVDDVLKRPYKEGQWARKTVRQNWNDPYHPRWGLLLDQVSVR